MGKFSLNQLMNDKSKEESVKEPVFSIELIPIEKIEPSKMNKYNVDDVAELKASIELVGLQQNLVVRRQPGTEMYELISGHRRFIALQRLLTEGNAEFGKVPCKIIKSADDIQAELQLILANSTSRQLTDYEKTYQAGRLKELLGELKKSGYKFTGRTREIIAEFLKVSPSQVGRMESINNNLSPELTEKFKEGEVNITTAYELSRLDGEQQELALQEYESGSGLNPDSAKVRRVKTPAEPEIVEPERENMGYSAFNVSKAVEYFKEILWTTNKYIEACKLDGTSVPEKLMEKRMYYTMAIEGIKALEKKVTDF